MICVNIDRGQRGICPICAWRVCNQRKMCGHPQSDPYIAGALRQTLTRPRIRNGSFCPAAKALCTRRSACARLSFFSVGPRQGFRILRKGRHNLRVKWLRHHLPNAGVERMLLLVCAVYCNIWHAVHQQWSLTFLAHSAMIFYALSARSHVVGSVLFVLHALFASGRIWAL